MAVTSPLSVSPPTSLSPFYTGGGRAKSTAPSLSYLPLLRPANVRVAAARGQRFLGGCNPSQRPFAGAMCQRRRCWFVLTCRVASAYLDPARKTSHAPSHCAVSSSSHDSYPTSTVLPPHWANTFDAAGWVKRYVAALQFGQWTSVHCGCCRSLLRMHQAQPTALACQNTLSRTGLTSFKRNSRCWMHSKSVQGYTPCGSHKGASLISEVAMGCSLHI